MKSDEEMEFLAGNDGEAEAMALNQQKCSDAERLIYYIKEIGECKYEPDKILIFQEKALKKAKALLNLIERLEKESQRFKEIYDRNSNMNNDVERLKEILDKMINGINGGLDYGIKDCYNQENINHAIKKIQFLYKPKLDLIKRLEFELKNEMDSYGSDILDILSEVQNGRMSCMKAHQKLNKIYKEQYKSEIQSLEAELEAMDSTLGGMTKDWEREKERADKLQARINLIAQPSAFGVINQMTAQLQSFEEIREKAKKFVDAYNDDQPEQALKFHIKDLQQAIQDLEKKEGTK